ncbi:DNA cytosine methyltransferase [Dyella koreensis]|uniref:DNA (cytosine-5-)-methyltransferase n=1 Tax=Dyella koreensis TaxID=311235 RepID=A0ABW8K943_9GAMM
MDAKKKRKNTSAKKVASITFADVFAGCGGLSLGLVNAGWKGTFAIERHADAFGTLATNLVNGRPSKRKFAWPQWLPKSEIATSDLLGGYGKELAEMKGKLTLLAGGPPCQGFSLAGRRTQSDPRNALTEDYIEMVRLLEPRFLLIENVRGFTLPFKKNVSDEHDAGPYSDRVKESLEKIGYRVYSDLIDLSRFGVPQSRKRFILIAIKCGDKALKKLDGSSPIDLLYKQRVRFLANKRIPYDRPVSVKEAIGDLEIKGGNLLPCTDSPLKGFNKVSYERGKYRSSFISLMRKGVVSEPNSLRLPNHNESTRTQFKLIMDTCVKGRTLTDLDRKRLKLKKHAITPLEGTLPSATITTLPDDIIHYSEPRILTARESARLQTFPDTYQFTGKYTTGGPNRKNECPRYTQIGNAVPPLFAEAIGRMLKQLAS